MSAEDERRTDIYNRADAAREALRAIEDERDVFLDFMESAKKLPLSSAKEITDNYLVEIECARMRIIEIEEELDGLF